MRSREFIGETTDTIKLKPRDNSCAKKMHDSGKIEKYDAEGRTRN
jgi:hypothetical protein